MLAKVRIDVTGNVLHASFWRQLTDDAKAELADAVERLIELHGNIRVLLQLHDFHGWETGALSHVIGFDPGKLEGIDRLAIVADEPRGPRLPEYHHPLTTVHIRFYPEDELDEAIRWIDEPEQGASVTTPERIAKLLEKLLETDVETRARARAELVRMGNSIIGELRNATKSHDRRLRSEVTKTLAEMEDPATAAVLAHQLGDTYGISWAAAEGLTKLGKHGAEAILHELIRHPTSNTTRIGARHALSHMEDLSVRRMVAPVVVALAGVAAVQQGPVAASEALSRMWEGSDCSA